MQKVPPASHENGPPQNASPCITCGLCFGVLSEPLTLPCHHSFCLRCLRERVDKGGPGSGVTCALCNALYQDVGLRNLSDLLDNELSNYIATISRGGDSRPICQWCDESAASIFCPDCQYILCGDCNNAVHKNSAKRGHQPQALQDGKIPKVFSRKCVIRGHEEYRLEFYCLRCEQLCCAYCLQIGPHHQHDNVLVSKAANEVRQQMGRDLEMLGQLKATIESQANELNRVHGQYLESYDHVETVVTERFKAFKQQLLQKEREVRNILDNLRDIGDTSMCDTRSQFLRKLNAINEAGLSFKRLQHGGADYEVLENRERMGQFLRVEVPQVTGTGFRLSDMGDLNLAGLTISLDLHSNARPNSASNGATAVGGASEAAAGGSRGGSAVAAPPPAIPQRDLQMQRRSSLRFTFLPDPDVEMREVPDGVLFRCVDRPSNAQVGIRANETFESLREMWAAEGGQLGWRIRLDGINESFLGVVDGNDNVAVPEGFYWRPMRQGHYNGKVGRPTHLLGTIPACRTGDVVRFVYDTAQRTLKLSVNNVDRGIIVTELPPQVTPCFIFRPGEAATLLF